MPPPIGGSSGPTSKLFLTPNVSVSIYRTANPSSPYPSGSPALSGVSGYLRPMVQNGRFGTALYLHWTHILYLPPGTDIRDAYNSQLDPSRNNTIADTVIVQDSSNPNTKTAYFVVFVEIVLRGTPGQYVRAYLDRFQPNAWPTDSI
jgi:hypothetical protein